MTPNIVLIPGESSVENHHEDLAAAEIDPPPSLSSPVREQVDPGAIERAGVHVINELG